MNQEAEVIRVEEGKGPETAVVRNTGIEVAEIVKLYNTGKDPFKEYPELQPMDLVAVGSFYGKNAAAFRDKV